MNDEIVIDEDLKKAMDEMMKLYKCGNLKEIARIRDDKYETSDRRMAAHTFTQLHPDPLWLI